MDIIKELSTRLDTSAKVKFKLYSLEYIIEKKDNMYIIYPELYSRKDKKTYKSLEELLNNYNIYNESILNNLNRVTNIQ